MLIIRGVVDDVELAGTLYEPDEQPPPFKGAPDEDAPYVWICDEFYEVESGGQVQHIAGQEVHLAFEHPMPRGFASREQAIAAGKEHVLTQFVRIGIERDRVEVEVVSE